MVDFSRHLKLRPAFGYPCQECGEGTVQGTTFPEYVTKIQGADFVVPNAYIGVCTVCNAFHYSAHEQRRWEQLFADSKTIRGTCASWVEHRRTKEVTQRECEWEIYGYDSGRVGFKLTKGGVTGYESFSIRDDKDLNRWTLDRIFIDDPKGYWSACAGCGNWDAQRINNDELRDAIQQWLDREGITYPELEV